EERLREKLLWLWVRKEAYVKYLGTGIGEGLKTFSVVQEGTAGDFREKDGYQKVELCGIPEAEHELELAVYTPEEEIEEIIWRNW
ncbi:MAG: 4-phosphopantetheinyl transferase family protein, partial [Firmicutes bacterium]|nr:4-phosphopantetheinyl transferase family protein [Bacillota bacterium]